MPLASTVLSRLRKTPFEACKNYRFEVESEVYTGQNKGGTCSVSCQQSQMGSNIYRLSASSGSSDFFYPWRTAGQGGLGYVEVPRHVRPGTLILTSGMNGCSLHIHLRGGSYIFIHDADGKSFDADHNPEFNPGKQVCTIRYDDYAGSDEIGKKKFNEQFSKVSKSAKKISGAGFSYYLITVKTVDGWHVFATGVITCGKKTPIDYGSTPLLYSFG